MFGRELRMPVDLMFGSPPELEPSLEYLYHLLERLRVVYGLTYQVRVEAGSKQWRAYDECHGQGLWGWGEGLGVQCCEKEGAVT